MFKSEPVVDPVLGAFHRSGGAWRGIITLPPASSVPLILTGSRSTPDAEALRLARTIVDGFPRWRPEIERALLDHLAPYADSVAAGELDPPSAGWPAVTDPSEVWDHVTTLFVHVAPLGGVLTVEIGYAVAWDEEHTLGARVQNGTLLELCGSILSP
jgi:hypothetical protein